jgi:separase
MTELKNELAEHRIERRVLDKMKNADLVDTLLEKRLSRPSISTPSSDAEVSVTKHIFLILDENLHRFPFEGLSVLSGKAVSRVPSLPFILAPLMDAENLVVDPTEAKYVIDPESNLTGTSDRIVPMVESIVAKHGWDWKGVVGTVPPPSFVEDAVRRENGLFLYCGHGGGQACFSRSKVESLITGNEEAGLPPRSCKSSLILMGCSSGKWVAPNRKGIQVFDKVPIHYEPEGISLSYLCAGAPCVIGNLWDVTDRDIDK